ncbi:hypothetical protein CARUB_v10019197mg [Capsella rubella]|uniref:Calmodulin-binding domain-containing protein n=1 Tax=Capsella rubella TaxID=81985 RepID=R0HE49_9BRAS|nr:uncharacterized protein LOC17887106 [Capsella rubella]EOA23320.1 hypothetical protein CARUB_v10019197mg [Capsella rubella]
MIQRKTTQDRLQRSHGPEEMIKRRRTSMLPQPTTRKKQIVAKIIGGSSPNYMKGTNSSEARRQSQGFQPTTPKKQIVAKVTGGSPNYMKGTSSSEAKRQSRSFQPGSDKKSQSCKKLDNSCSGDKKQSSSSRSSAGGLKKILSFKRSYSIGLCCNRATCSSFVKNSKFREDLMRNTIGVLKVCPYTYCSLNTHLHEQCPPLKDFISARRRSLKSHASVKKSSDVGCVDIYVDKKKENVSTRDIDIQVIDFETEKVDMKLGKAEGLESKRVEIVNLLDGEGIESCDSCDEKVFSLIIENFAVLEQSENPGGGQKNEESGFSDNSINILLSEQSTIQDDTNLGKALDEKLNSKKSENWKEVDDEKLEERIALVSKTEETLLTIAREPCNREECTENSREFNPREPNYLPITAERSSEIVELKHQDMYKIKNTEEWMTDCALQHTVSKLAVERKKNASLLVEAFETTLTRERSKAFTH